MSNYTANFKIDNPVDFFHYIEPKKKLVCASYDPSSGYMSKTYATLTTDGKRHTVSLRERLKAVN